MHRMRFVALFFTITTTIIHPTRAGAATFTVDSGVDAPDANPVDGICATVAGACTLRAAVQTANAVPGADVIVVPAGTYTLAIAGADEDQAARGDLDVSDALTIAGAGAVSTVIDGGAIDRVLDVHATSLAVRDATIRNGNAAGYQLHPPVGGGLRADGSNVLLERVTVSGCRGVTGGGVLVSAGSLDVRSSTITGNDAWELYGLGGGIAVGPGNATGSCVITDTTITANHATLGGGGVYVAGDVTTMSAVIARTVIADNVTAADNAWGGGVLASGQTDIDETVISGNVAYRGGGLYEYDPPFRIARSTITGNHATEGGGLALGGGLAENVTVSGNSAFGDGGGVIGGKLRNVTVTGNVADADADGDGQGGGVLYVDLANSIVTGNTRGGGAGDDCSSTTTSNGYNLIERAETCVLGGDLTGVVLGLPAALGPLAMNGGPTATHALLAGSPALDAGNPAAAGSGPVACPAVDQRSAARPYGTGCDLGAVEQTYVISACGNGVLDGGEQCDDGNVRDGDCCASTCEYAAVGSLCSADTNVCTDDTCDGAGACVTANNTGRCTTNTYCTVDETCSGGTCGGGVPRPCDDGVTCSADVCHPMFGCVHVADDSRCDDSDACTTDVCSLAPYPLIGGGCAHYAASGPVCDDGNVCTTDDTCIVGLCRGDGHLACADCLACDPVTGCTVEGPEPTCRVPNRPGWSKLLVTDSTNDAADTLKWTWKANNGATVIPAPTAATTYDLCVYEESSGTPTLLLHATPATGDCGGTPCWTTSSRRYKYKDRLGTADGFTNIQLGLSSPTTRISMKAKGVNVPPFALPLPPDPAVVVQLRTSDGGCWGASFGTAQSNTATKFKAKSD